MIDLLDKIKEDLNNIFKDNNKRLRHIYGVAELSITLAYKLDADPMKCLLAAYLHDIHKNLSLDEQLSYLTEEEKNNLACNTLAHAYSAANYAKEKYKIEDEDVLNAIRSHVYGNLNMSVYDKILVMADFCELNRNYEYCVKARETLLSYKFDLALSEVLKYTISSLEERNIKPTDEQIEISRKYGV